MSLLLALALGCGGGATQAPVDTTAAPLVPEECAVCGMLVTEQPAPRAQLVYRDGTRDYYCSLGELRATLEARSPHGEPLAIYVEALPADFDPSQASTGALPWVPAEQAWYVVGGERLRVMGLPVLSYADQATASAAADRLGLAAIPWTRLRETPFNQIP